MKKLRRESRAWIAPWLALALVAGAAIGWWLRGGAPQPLASLLPPPRIDAPEPESTIGRIPVPTPGDETPAVTSPEPEPRGALPLEPTIGADPVADLRGRRLLLPLERVDVEKLKGMFAEGRDRGARPHEAVDMMAARNTPIRAVEDGVVAKLFLSKAGGLTIYQYDPSERFCYYYAHLEKYADGLKEGQRVRAGDVIGYVGSSGNASPNAPHLHFAIFKLTDEHHWWQGTPLDPYQVFRQDSPVTTQ